MASRASLTMPWSASSFSWASFFLASSLRLRPQAKDSSNEPLYHFQVEDQTSTCTDRGSLLTSAAAAAAAAEEAEEAEEATVEQCNNRVKEAWPQFPSYACIRFDLDVCV